MMRSLLTDRSVLRNPGPMTTLRPRLPNLLTATNTDGSNHWSGDPMMRIGPDESGRTVFGMPLIVRVARDDVDGIAALRLYDRGDLPVACHAVPSNGIVGHAEHESMTGIEVRQAVLIRDVVAVLHLESFEFSEFVSSDFDHVYDVSNCNPATAAW